MRSSSRDYTYAFPVSVQRCIIRRSIETSTDPTQRPLADAKLRDLSVDRVAAWSRANERALAPTTASLSLIALNQVCRYALRRGWLADNPVSRLEPGERPGWTPQPVGILEGTDLAQVLEHAGEYQPMFELLAYTGLRINEALGLRWCDVDFDAGLLHVRQQLSRARTPKRLKTDAGNRDVVLATSVAAILRDRWEASAHRDSEDLVFCSPNGTGRDYRKVGDAFRVAVKDAGITGRGRLSLHSLRHGFASLLIANGLNVVFVSRQLGHAKPTTTLRVYAHLFAQAEHANTARAALEARHQTLSQTTGPLGEPCAVETTVEKTYGLRTSEPRAPQPTTEHQN